MKTVRVHIDDDVIEYAVEGETAFGADEVLLDRDDDLLEKTGFAESGFTVAPFLDPASYETLVEGVRRLLREALLRHVRPTVDAPFSLEGYHRVVAGAEHLRLVGAMGLQWVYEELPVSMALVERRISEIVGLEVSAANPALEQQRFQVRVVRPGMSDNNPPHRDVWLDRLRHAVNIYVPLAGSDARSSLPILPGSHRWPEAEIERTCSGGVVGGVSYTVPAVTGTRRPFRLTRPRVRPNEVLVFTPYAIHGGGVNLNADRTRVSLELRFWRKK